MVASVVAFVGDAWGVAAAWAGHVPYQAGHTEESPALVDVLKNHCCKRQSYTF